MFCDNHFPVSSGNFNLHADGPIKGFPKLLGNDYATEMILSYELDPFQPFHSTSFLLYRYKKLTFEVCSSW